MEVSGVVSKKSGPENEMKEAEEWDLAIQFCNSMRIWGNPGIVGSYSDWWSSKWRGEIKMIEEVMAPPRRSRQNLVLISQA